MLGPDKLLLTSIVPPTYSLLFEGTVKFLPSNLLRIKSDVPVTVQRYDDINYVVGVNPMGVGSSRSLL
jgi:hypothetical protein